jgi:hypothetical protein
MVMADRERVRWPTLAPQSTNSLPFDLAGRQGISSYNVYVLFILFRR